MPDDLTQITFNAQIAALEEKIGSLRRTLFATTLGGAAVLAIVIGWGVNARSPAAPGADTIEARSFVVRDNQGRARAVLQSLDDTGAQLVFFRDPVKGDAWRARAMPGPFVFAVRDWRGNAQLVLRNTDGTRIDLDPRTVTSGGSSRPR